MPRDKHQNKEIEAALAYAEENGWRIEKSTGGRAHSWGQMLCPTNDNQCRCGEFCRSSIWSTPRNPANHAKQIFRAVNRCIHKDGLAED